MKTRRNPNEILADLNEALRRGRVANLSSMSLFSDMQGRVPVYHHKTDLSQPAFDFGYNLDDIEHAVRKEAHETGMKMLMAGELRLPFQQCIFIVSITAKDATGGTVDSVILLDQTDENEILATVFEEEWAAGKVHFRLRDGKIVTWTGNEQCVKLAPGHFSMLTPFEDYAQELPEGTYERDLAWSKGVANTVVAGLAMLARAGTESREAPPTPASEAVNRGRMLGKLSPLPLVRTIHIDRDRVVSHGTGNGTGNPVRPHFRRGHWRTLADGRRVPVREAKIHGGPSDAAPPIYAVV
jgi:hypothetical protein